ncbi:hypothetical protein ACFVGN_38565 [Streptomyces sp. NPDC057757]|uniref:hypothetical protein n=1 Tax=Streptomyces sp. NPDC057757 TaxID=3346241 RepID=UPI00368FE7F6
MALESAQMLMSPEVAEELATFREGRALADVVARDGAVPMPVGPKPQALRSGGACALCDVVKPDRHALRDHVLNVHPDEFCGIFHAQPCQHDRRDRYAKAVLQVKGLAGLFADVRAHVDPVMALADEELAALRARVAELETERHSTNEALDDVVRELRADVNRPIDEEPIPFDLTPRAEAAADRLTALFAPTQALREEKAAGQRVEWCTGCNTDHDPAECGYRPESGGAR